MFETGFSGVFEVADFNGDVNFIVCANAEILAFWRTTCWNRQLWVPVTLEPAVAQCCNFAHVWTPVHNLRLCSSLYTASLYTVVIPAKSRDFFRKMANFGGLYLQKEARAKYFLLGVCSPTMALHTREVRRESIGRHRSNRFRSVTYSAGEHGLMPKLPDFFFSNDNKSDWRFSLLYKTWCETWKNIQPFWSYSKKLETTKFRTVENRQNFKLPPFDTGAV